MFFILRVKYLAWRLPLDSGGICGVTYFSQKGWQEKGTAHARAAVDFPVGDVHADVGERFVPREDMLIGAVDQRAIQVEKYERERDGLAWRCIVVVREGFHMRFVVFKQSV
ncbi:MAG TPA: hypothetical protein VK818_01860 [Methylomirabilota bacterium]|nr:hypothetical protein [Methylomirabilota bacterium]